MLLSTSTPSYGTHGERQGLLNIYVDFPRSVYLGLLMPGTRPFACIIHSHGSIVKVIGKRVCILT